MTVGTAIVVFDLEWTAWEGSVARRWRGPDEEMEIVEIGAVKLDGERELMETDSFETLVRPRLNPILSDYFVDLTGITQARLDAEGMEFAAALTGFSTFLGKDVQTAFSFGYDPVVIEENCRLHGLAFPFGTGFFTDAKPVICEALRIDEGSLVSSQLPARLGFSPPGNAHQAIADARCVAEALRILWKRGLWAPPAQE